MSKNSRYAADEKKSEALASALVDLPENWLACRDMRHAWVIVTDFHVEKNQGRTVQTVTRVLSCTRCETQRTEHYAMGKMGLDKISQTYSYPENYAMKGVPRGNKPASMVQAEQYRRAMERMIAQHQLNGTPPPVQLEESEGDDPNKAGFYEKFYGDE